MGAARQSRDVASAGWRLPRRYAPLEELKPEPIRTVGAGLPANNAIAQAVSFAGKPAPTGMGRTVLPRFVTAQRGELLAMTKVLNK